MFVLAHDSMTTILGEALQKRFDALMASVGELAEYFGEKHGLCVSLHATLGVVCLCLSLCLCRHQV